VGEGVGIPSLPQGGSIGQPPAYLLSSAAPAPFSLVPRDPRGRGVRVGHYFDRYVAEHNIPEGEWPEAFARWIAERTGGLGFREVDAQLGAVAGVPAKRGPAEPVGFVIEEQQDELEGVREADVVQLRGRRERERGVASVE